jgi:hypothetical protein
MFQFSKRSSDNLAQCDPRLQKVAHEAANYFNFTIICGHRGQEEQDRAWREGRSKLRFPRSKHNQAPSLAMDCVPYPLDWNDTKAFQEMARVMKQAAKTVGVDLVWGGDWKGFVDMPHFEVKP